ncbi:MAG: hypothetical protein D6735_10690 [Acidobacteria bacterium]|nr:MAG: hypothetical protein D6735_10690 [Acidobacteriota bacterium]
MMFLCGQQLEDVLI